MKIARSFATFAGRGVAALALLWVCGLAAAQEAADPPGRVGRLADLQGQVWLYTPDGGEWISAVRNRPVTTGDRLSTDAGARAELRIGSMTLRLDGGTELEALRIDDDRVDLQLHHGSLSARLGSREIVREFSLRTDEGTFRVQRTGRYRFDRRDETSHLTVYGGEAVYEGPRSALTVYSGQRAEFWLDSANAAQYSITDPERDAFAAWTSERDRADERSASARYVSPEMTGVEDLDRYGRWQQDEENGPVWIPRDVSPGWAPYSAGHWAWVSPWGWTWVDDAPWGFAPFHYGRWVWLRNTWCWAPGRRVLRPVYAPALVGWIGGPHVSLSLSIGAGPMVGWFPLAPREVYVPAYRVSPRYVRDVNITHVTNITNITNITNTTNQPRDPRGALINNAPQDRGHPEFRNRRIPGAVTVVPTSVLSSRQPVAPAAAEVGKTSTVRDMVASTSRGIPLVAPPVAAPVSTSREVRSQPPQPGVRPTPRPPQERGTALPREPVERVDRVDRSDRVERVAPAAPGTRDAPDRRAPPLNRNDDADADSRARPRAPLERVAPPPTRGDAASSVAPMRPPAAPERRPRELGESGQSAPSPQVQPLARPRVQPSAQDAPNEPPPQTRRPERQVDPAPAPRMPERMPEPRPPVMHAPEMPRTVAPPPRAPEPRAQQREERRNDRQDERRDRELLPRGKER